MVRSWVCLNCRGHHSDIKQARVKDLNFKIVWNGIGEIELRPNVLRMKCQWDRALCQVVPIGTLSCHLLCDRIVADDKAGRQR